MAINLKNYTTSVAASKSQAMITQLLIEFGARDIATSYEKGGKLSAIRFIVEIEGQKLPFELPANVTAVFLWLKQQHKSGGKGSTANDTERLAQAERIAWKNAYEWLYQQIMQIELGQMEKMEAFLYRFYDYASGQTFYKKLKETNFKGLLEAPKI